METLICSNCGGPLIPDSSGLTGSCPYCGSVTQLVQRVEVRHTGLFDWKAKLDAAKTLYQLGETQRSEELLQQLCGQYPQNPEIWLLLSLIHAPAPEEQIRQDPEWYRNTDIRSALLTLFSQEKEIQYARALLSEEQSSLYNDYLRQYVARLDAEFALVQTVCSQIEADPFRLTFYGVSAPLPQEEALPETALEPIRDAVSPQPTGWNSAPSQPAGWNSAPSQPAGWNSAPSRPAGWNSAPSRPAGWNPPPDRPADGGFFLLESGLFYTQPATGDTYAVRKVEDGCLCLGFQTAAGPLDGRPKNRFETCRITYISNQFCLLGGQAGAALFYLAEHSVLCQQQYIRQQQQRRQMRLCPVCGSQMGITGCRQKCSSKIQ